jgi:hypothetical protein
LLRRQGAGRVPRATCRPTDTISRAFSHPFLLGAGEPVILAQVARDLGAIRNLVGESPTEDAFHASFWLVYCTSDLFVVLMSIRDVPTLCPVLGR